MTRHQFFPACPPFVNTVYESKKIWLWRSARPSAHTLHVSRCQMSVYFGGKAYGHPCLVKQRQLKSRKMFLYPCCLRYFLKKLKLIVMSTNLEYRERERLRKRESRATGQRSSMRKSARAREKKQRRRLLLKEQHENCVAAVRKWKMPAVTGVKMSDSKKKWTRTRTTLAPKNV